MRINHNMSAIFATRQLHTYSNRLDRTIERLASGEAIVRAGDDASNLAVSEKMRTQIRGLIQAEKNAQNGLSLLQVAEGSYQQLNEIMQRIRVLALQSANGIYSDGDRKLIQVEVSQLIDEVDRIATTAEFNRMKLLDGRFSAKKTNAEGMFFHVGAGKDERINVFIATVGVKAFNLVDQANNKRSIATVDKANSMIGIVDSAIDKVNQQRADLGAAYNRMEITTMALAQAYENMMAADSRIRDADMAAQMVEFTRDKILVQTSASMLVQANLKPQYMMKLFDLGL